MDEAEDNSTTFSRCSEGQTKTPAPQFSQYNFHKLTDNVYEFCFSFQMTCKTLIALKGLELPASVILMDSSLQLTAPASMTYDTLLQRSNLLNNSYNIIVSDS